MKRLFIFDFDGVIVDSLNLYENLVKRNLKLIGFPVIKTREEFLDLFDGNFYESLRERGVNIKAFNDAVMEASSGIDYRQIRPVDGLFPVITALARQNILIVISSNISSVIEKFLSRHGQEGIFAAVLGADFMLSKTRKIEHTMEKWRAACDFTYYVGDTVGDIREGKAACVKTVAATWGWHPRERFEGVGADFIVDAPEDLLSI